MAEAVDNTMVFVEVAQSSADDAIMQTQVKAEENDVVGVSTRSHKAASETVQYQEKRIRCPECKYYTTENEEKMTRHIRKMHRGENPFQCYMCDYSTYNKVCFEEHVRVHQGIKPYKCSFCPHRTVSKKNMKKHELVHRPDNPLKCQHCEFFGRHKHALNFHLRECHMEFCEEKLTEGSELCCKRCGLKFEDKSSLRSHNKSQRKCKQCEFVGCTSSMVHLHILKKHGESKSPRKKKEELFKCAICAWTSSSVARVLLHLIHHPKQKVDESIFDLSVLRKHGIVQ